MSFRGSHHTRIDEKGRLKMPADFKRLVDEANGSSFYITSRNGERAEIYPIKAWEEIEAKLELLGTSHPGRRKFLDVTNFYGQMAEMDSQGRLLLPQVLREAAGLTDEVVVLGQLGYLEVANKPRFVKKLEVEPMTAEDWATLAEVKV